MVAARDLVGEEVEESNAFSVAYRHFFTEALRSNVFYGKITTEIGDAERIHWGINLFKSINKHLTYGFEIGNFNQKDDSADSDYVQFSVIYKL